MILIKIMPQPDDVTCGPTCLHAIYQYYGDPISLEQVISEVPYLKEGGTLSVLLGTHALKRGYRALMHTYNLKVFDPTWEGLEMSALLEKLRLQKKVKNGKKINQVMDAYIEFLSTGGQVVIFEDLTRGIFEKCFKREIPVLAGLSSTFLHRTPREITLSQHRTAYDALRGEPAGHFVVLCGYDEEKDRVIVADPFHKDLSNNTTYGVAYDRLINAILLGVLTHDANLLILEK